MNKTILNTVKLSKTFSNGGIQQHVLKNLDIEIKEGDFTVIMGSSGSGKSTLLYALSGMDKPTLGKVNFEEEEISKYNNDELAVFRRKNCGFIFQQINLLDNMSILDNILVSGLLIAKDKNEIVNKAKKLLKQVGLDENTYNKFPSQLSGGEAQRVGVVRALINNPKIVFADEPTGALNSLASNNVLDILSSVNNDGQTVVMVTHDIKSALRGNRIIYIRDGGICGKLNLEKYDSKNAVQRHETIQEFLNEMGW